MNSFGHVRWLGALLAIATLLSACAMPASTRPGITVELHAPISGRVVALPAPDIFIHAQAHASGDATRIVFYANGLVIGEDTSLDISGDYNQSGMLHWMPTEPGEYLIQAEAQKRDGSAFSAAARVCVLPESDLLHPLTYWGYGYTGPCEIPLPNPDAPAGLEVEMLVHAIPSSLAYNFECPFGVGSATIAFEATLYDPSDRVAFVWVDYSVPAGGSGAPVGDTIQLNWTSSTAAGEKIFTGTTVDLAELFFYELGATGGILTWTARSIARDARDLAVDGPHEILATPCSAAVIGPPMPIEVEPSATFTPLPTDTPKPTLIPTKPKPGGGGGGSCSDHGNKDACTAAGCNWDPGKSTCG